MSQDDAIRAVAPERLEALRQPMQQGVSKVQPFGPRREPVLMSAAHPHGWKLEDLLDQLVIEVLAKCERLRGDLRPVARQVLGNNEVILERLQQAANRQRESVAALAAYAPDQGPTGTPRVGTGSLT